jgi:hypothetical protein
MRQQIVSVSGASLSSTIIPMNLDSTPFNVGFGAVVTGSATYQIKHTFDNPWSVASPTWFTHPSTATAATANLDGNYAFPVAAIKIETTAGTNTGNITLTVIQAGIA